MEDKFIRCLKRKKKNTLAMFILVKRKRLSESWLIGTLTRRDQNHNNFLDAIIILNGILVDKKLKFIFNIVINETSIFDKVRK